MKHFAWVAVGLALLTSLSGPAWASERQGAASVQMAAPTAQPPNGWVRREVPNWIYWVPNAKWVDTHNMNGIDVSSPTGDIVVSWAWAGTPLPVSLPELIDYLFTPANTEGLSRITLREGPVTGAPGDQRQTVTWTATRQHPLKGAQAVRGATKLHVFTVDYGAYGFEVTSMMSPVQQWKRNLPTMRMIQGNILYIPS